MTIEVNTDGADILAEKLKGLPQKLQTRISRVILREALKETGAREELRNCAQLIFTILD